MDLSGMQVELQFRHVDFDRLDLIHEKILFSNR